MDSHLLHLAAVAYAVAVALYAGHVLRGRPATTRGAALALAAGIALHAWSVALRTSQWGVLPFRAPRESIGLLALLVGVAALLLERLTRRAAIGAIGAPLAFAFLGLAHVMPKAPQATPAVLQSPWFAPHVAFAFAGHACFALAAGASALFFFEDRLVRLHRITPLARRLPALETLDRLNRRCVAVGLVFESIGILSGVAWAADAWGRWLRLDDTKTVSSFVLWAVFAAGLAGRRWAGWRGRRAAEWTLAGAALAILSYIALSWVGVGPHANLR